MLRPQVQDVGRAGRQAGGERAAATLERREPASSPGESICAGQLVGVAAAPSLTLSKGVAPLASIDQ